jgi:hypothetical protein
LDLVAMTHVRSLLPKKAGCHFLDLSYQRQPFPSRAAASPLPHFLSVLPKKAGCEYRLALAISQTSLLCVDDKRFGNALQPEE